MRTIVTMKDRRIVIVGAAGFLGRAIIQALRPTGCRIVGVDVAAAPDLDTDEWIVADLLDGGLPAEALADTDVVVHLAWRNIPGSGNTDMRADVAGNVACTVQVFEQAARAGVRRIVYASSGGTIYGRAPTPTPEDQPIAPIGGYGAGKASAEIYLNAIHCAHGIQTCTLRVANPYGPGQLPDRGQGFIATALAHALRDQPIEIFGSLALARDYVFIDDVAEAFVLACADESPQVILNVGSGQPRTLAEILDHVGRIIGRDARIEHVAGRSMDIPTMALDISRIETALGWRPTTPLDEGLARTTLWLDEHLAKELTVRARADR